MNKSIRRLITAMFFVILSLPWFYGASLALAQNAQPAEPTPTAPVKQVPIGEILKFGENTDWCRSTFVTASVFNYVNTYIEIKAKEVQILFDIYHNPKHESAELVALAKNYRNTQSLLNIAYMICAAAPKYVSIVTSP